MPKDFLISQNAAIAKERRIRLHLCRRLFQPRLHFVC